MRDSAVSRQLFCLSTSTDSRTSMTALGTRLVTMSWSQLLKDCAWHYPIDASSGEYRATSLSCSTPNQRTKAMPYCWPTWCLKVFTNLWHCAKAMSLFLQVSASQFLIARFQHRQTIYCAMQTPRCIAQKMQDETASQFSTSRCLSASINAWR